MSRIILGLLLAAFSITPVFADLSQDDVLSWVESLGGSYVRNEAGNVTAVDLRSAWLTDGDLGKLAYLPKLESINLAYTKITDLALEHLIPLENVKDLNLYYAEYVTDAGIAHLKNWKNLEHLDVCGTKVTSSVFEHVSQMSKLKSLDVGFSRVTDDGFENLMGLERLEKLGFGGNKMSGVALPLLKLLPSLRELNVSGGQRTDSGTWSVSITDFNLDNIVQLEQLEVLDIGEAAVTDRGVAKLAQMKNLQSLDLRLTSVTSKGIAALIALHKLRHLKLWQAARIDNSAIPHFLQMKSLEILEIPETGITDEGLEKLAEMKQLRKLYVGGTNVTEEQVEAFREASPDCLISWWEKFEVPERIGE